MPKHDTVFNPEWCNRYTWVKPKSTDNSMALCKLCNCEVSVANRGEGALTQHAKTKKHEKAENAAANSLNLPHAFQSMS